MHQLRAPQPSDQESVGTLVSRLGNDVTRVVRAEIGLVQTRVNAAVEAVRAAGALLAVGLVLALGGVGALVAGLVLVVATALPAWAAAFVVAGGLLLLAGILLAVQVRVVTGGVREALSDVQVQIRGEEAYRGD